GLDLGPLGGGGADIYEDRSREREVLARFDGVARRKDRHAGFRIDDGNELQPVLVLQIVSVAEEAEGERISRDPLHEYVIVFTGYEVAAACSLLTDDRVG